MKKILLSSFIATLLFATVAGIISLNPGRTSAATHTLTPGQSIQAALNAALPGDTITLAAGVYNERLEIIKPVTLKGDGAVTINTKESTNINLPDYSVYTISNTPAKAVAIYDTTNVTIENITFDGENAGAGPTRQTGIDISGVAGMNLSNVVVKNYIKNGIAVSTQYDTSRPIARNIAFNNVTVDNAAWSGIAFYTMSATNNSVALKGVTFSGTTTISNAARGIQFGDITDTQPVEGVNGGPVALGTVVFAGNTANIVQGVPSLTSLTLTDNSTVDGAVVTAANFTGLSLTIVEPVIPTVPDTSIAR